MHCNFGKVEHVSDVNPLRFIVCINFAFRGWSRHRQWQICMETFFDSTQAECTSRQTMKLIKTTLNFTAKVTILARPLAVGSYTLRRDFSPDLLCKAGDLVTFRYVFTTDYLWFLQRNQTLMICSLRASAIVRLKTNRRYILRGTVYIWIEW